MVNAARDTAAEPRTQPKYGDGKYYTQPKTMVNAARDTAAEPRTQPKYGDGKYYGLWSMQCHWRWVGAHRVIHVGHKIG